MHSISMILRKSLFYINERMIDHCLASIFTPRECRFISYLIETNYAPKRRLDPFEAFEEHIPYCRRDYILLKFNQLILTNTVPEDKARLTLAFKRVGDKSPSHYLHKRDMGVSCTYHS